jgi:hypothetical protein
MVPVRQVDWAKWSAGVVFLLGVWDRPGDTGPGHWHIGDDSGPEVAVPQLDGQAGVAFAVDGDRAYLLSPAGTLAVVPAAGVLSTETVTLPQPASMPDSPLQLAVWSRGKLVRGDAQRCRARRRRPRLRPRPRTERDEPPPGWPLAGRLARRPRRVYVYGQRAGTDTLLLHLLAGPGSEGDRPWNAGVRLPRPTLRAAVPWKDRDPRPANGTRARPHQSAGRAPTMTARPPNHF